MNQSEQPFDEVWRARAAIGDLSYSWANDVILTLEPEGTRYLATLAEWFMQFPAPNARDRKALRTRLESFNTSDHLGAANELAWYQFMSQSGFQVAPIPTSKTPRPDFKVTAPASGFVEVSTLNVSEKEKISLQASCGVDLNHRETVRRLLLKASDEKHKQLEFATTNGLPCILVLFDYTTWSGFATEFYHFLASELLGDGAAFRDLPNTLSAIVYVERKVIGGRIVLSRIRSAVYHNPGARYHFEPSAFSMLRQFGPDFRETYPNTEGDWIEL